MKLYLLLLPIFLFAAPVALDNTFDSNGITTTVFSGTDTAKRVAIQADGKIIVAGQTSVTPNEFAIARYLSNGLLDTTFSGDGKQEIDLCSGADDNRFEAMALQSDGKIVLGGYCLINGSQDFILTRLQSDGSIDTTSFSPASNGMVRTDLDNQSGDHLVDIAIQNDGKIIAVGETLSGSNSRAAILRYESNGTLDSTFNGDGKLYVTLGDASLCSGRTGGAAQAVSIRDDGKIIIGVMVCVSSQWGVSTVAIDTNGTTDGAYNTAVLTKNDDLMLYDMTLDPNDKAILTGYRLGSTRQLFLQRYTTNGIPDTAFNSTGYTELVVEDTIYGGYYSTYGYALTTQSNGNILVAGSLATGSSTGNELLIARYKTDGSLDMSFNGSGYVMTDTDSSYPNIANDTAFDIALSRSQNAFFVVGEGTVNDYFLVAKYNNPLMGAQPAVLMYLLQ